MNRIIAKVWAPLAVITEIALLTSLVTDLVFQYKDRKANMVETYKVRSNWSAYSDLIYALDEYPIVLTVGGVEGEAVDPGLSVRWASWNLGASSPEDYGNYFAWGETEPKWDYSWSTYKWCNGSELFITKYCIDNSYWAGVGSKDNKKTLDAEDDAAHVKWGGNRRIPQASIFLGTLPGDA